jgi:O-antigen/teichoic acid export membrane protein
MLGFGAAVGSARLLGPAGRGELAILIVVPTLLAVALELGQEFTTSQMSAEHPEQRAALYGNATLYAVLVVALSFPVVAAAYHELLPHGTRAMPAAALAALAVGSSVFGKAAGGIVLGARRVAFYSTARVALSGSYLTGVLLVAESGRPNASRIFAAWTVSNLVLVAVYAFAHRRLRPRLSRKTAGVQFRRALPIHGSNLSQFLLLRADQVLLAVFATGAALGQYAVAVNAAETVWYMPMIAGLVSLPFLSASDRTFEEKRRALTTGLRAAVWFPAAVACVVAVAAPLAVPTVFGSGYSAAVAPLELLLPGVAVAGVARVGASALIATGQAGLMMRLTATALAGNVLLNVALIPRFGASGAAVASSISYACLGVTSWRATSSTWAITLSEMRLRRRPVTQTVGMVEPQ